MCSLTDGGGYIDDRCWSKTTNHNNNKNLEIMKLIYSALAIISSEYRIDKQIKIHFECDEIVKL